MNDRLEGRASLPSTGRAADWDRAYVTDRAPWDIGRPQAVFRRLADAGEFRSPVLDSGCGTGEHALMLAARGLEVVGVDLAGAAVERAEGKARERGLSVEFHAGDVLQVPRLGRRFGSVLDSGTFHVFDDDDRGRYVAALADVVERGGVVYLLCFSERVPGTFGPRRVSRAELRAAFANGWCVERIDSAEFEVMDWFPAPRPHAWLARISRLAS